MSVDHGSTRAVQRAEFAAPGDGIGQRTNGQTAAPASPTRSREAVSR